MDKIDALVSVFSRNAFYRQMHFLILGVFGLMIVIIGFLVGTYFYLSKNPVHPVYFATDDVSRLLKVVPVNVPNMTVDEISDWTVEAVESALSYDYVNYRAQLQNAQKYFTNYGWTQYMSAIRANNNLLAVTQRKIIGLAVVVDKPKLIVQGILGGAYAWKFEVPVLVTYLLPPYDGKSKFTNALNVSVVVQRQTELQGYMGLGVVQIIANLASNPSSQPQEISGTPNV